MKPRPALALAAGLGLLSSYGYVKLEHIRHPFTVSNLVDEALVAMTVAGAARKISGGDSVLATILETAQLDQLVKKVATPQGQRKAIVAATLAGIAGAGGSYAYDRATHVQFPLSLENIADDAMWVWAWRELVTP